MLTLKCGHQFLMQEHARIFTSWENPHCNNEQPLESVSTDQYSNWPLGKLSFGSESSMSSSITKMISTTCPKQTC